MMLFITINFIILAYVYYNVSLIKKQLEQANTQMEYLNKELNYIKSQIKKRSYSNQNKRQILKG
mgnify:CR=1 FL=1